MQTILAEAGGIYLEVYGPEWHFITLTITAFNIEGVALTRPLLGLEVGL